MPKPDGDMIQGMLDMLILQTLLPGPAHGHTIAHVIEHRSDQILQVEHGSMYPALYRLEARGCIASFAGVSEINRKAKFYKVSAAVCEQFAVDTSRCEGLARGIAR